MAVKDLEAKQGKVDIILKIAEIGDVREFNKFGKAGRVANATAKDETGEIKVTLWNEQIDQVKKGDTVQITNGYVSEFQGEKQLSTGRFGKLEVIGNSKIAESVTEDEMTEKKALEGEKSDEGEHVLTEDEKKEEEKNGWKSIEEDVSDEESDDDQEEEEE